MRLKLEILGEIDRLAYIYTIKAETTTPLASNLINLESFFNINIIVMYRNSIKFSHSHYTLHVSN